MKAGFKFTSLIILWLVIYPFLILSGSNAQGLSLSIYPPIIEVDTTPPSSPTVPITIQNNNSEDVELEIVLTPFKTDGVTGSVILDPAIMQTGFYPYYKQRIQFLLDGKKTNSIKLEALESKEIILNINLEKGDPPGDYYYSISFISQTNQPRETSISQLPAGIATNLILSIGPREEARGGITEFTTSKFKSKGPIEFKLLIHNASKHVINPTGTITITNMFGQKVGSIPLLPQYILAGSDRQLISEKHASGEARLKYKDLDTNPRVIWEENFLLGWYKADASVKLADNGRTITSSTYFIAFPIYLFFPLVILIFISLSIYLRVKKKI